MHLRGFPGSESSCAPVDLDGRMWDKEARMNDDKSEHKNPIGCLSRCGTSLARAVSIGLLLVSLRAFAANEETLGTLQVGSHTYQNVTVRTKAKDYILIVHSAGITSIKATQLPAEVREKLGYASDNARVAASTKVAKRGVAWVEGLKTQISQIWQRTGLGSKLRQLQTGPTLIGVVAALVIAHLFCSYCCMLICQKTGNNPGLLVWLPLLQGVPMLRAASMSVWWLGALFIPGLNLLGWVLWCVKIVRARRKTMPLALLLSFPLTSWFAFLFLAFSEDSRHQGEKVRVEAMTFQSVCGPAESIGVKALLQREQHIVA